MDFTGLNGRKQVSHQIVARAIWVPDIDRRPAPADTRDFAGGCLRRCRSSNSRIDRPCSCLTRAARAKRTVDLPEAMRQIDDALNRFDYLNWLGHVIRQTRYRRI